jgi:hypothetical protein
MARNIALSVLVTRCLRRANKETDPNVEPYETKALISELYGEMHAAVAETGSRYFETEATITTTGATSYPLPDGHLSTLGVDFRVDTAEGPRPR